MDAGAKTKRLAEANVFEQTQRLTQNATYKILVCLKPKPNKNHLTRLLHQTRVFDSLTWPWRRGQYKRPAMHSR